MDSRLTLGATHNLAIMLRKLGDIEAAIALDEDTHGRRLRLLGKRHPHTLISVLTLVRLYRQAGQGIKAMEMCNEALATSRATLGVGHYITHDLAALKGVLLYDAGRFKRHSRYNRTPSIVVSKCLVRRIRIPSRPRRTSRGPSEL